MVLTTGQTDAEKEKIKPVGQEQVRKWREVLERYRASRKKLEDRVISAENWWKMRNTFEGRKDSEIGKDGGFTSRSAWLHNVIVSKHADAMDAFPEPNILPREQGDEPEAKKLRSIIPCVLERNGFEEVYDDVQSAKILVAPCDERRSWDAGCDDNSPVRNRYEKDNKKIHGAALPCRNAAPALRLRRCGYFRRLR